MELQQQPEGKSPLVVVWQPDGSLAIGADPARMPYKEHAVGQASSSRTTQNPTPEDSAAALAALEERRAEAFKYRRTTLWRRKTIFLALVGLARQHSDQDSWLPDTAPSIDNLSAADPYYSSEDSTTGSSSGHIIGDISSGSGHILLALTWWINPKTLRLQDVLCSVAADLLGVAGAIQLRTAVLFLYCVIQLLSTTALTTIGGVSLSLFTMYRLLLLLLALYLRTAILVYMALLEAAELPLAPEASARLQRVLSTPLIGRFFGMLLGPGTSRRQRRSSSSRNSSSSNRVQQQTAAAAALPVAEVTDISTGVVPMTASGADGDEHSAGALHQRGAAAEETVVAAASLSPALLVAPAAPMLSPSMSSSMGVVANEEATGGMSVHLLHHGVGQGVAGGWQTQQSGAGMVVELSGRV